MSKASLSSLETMKGLLELFSSHCEDVETLNRLLRTIADRGSWPSSHSLFRDIRAKTLKAEKRNDKRILAQYLFEEVCAKTLYNLSGQSAPFDADSPDWIVPNALHFAEVLGVDSAEVLKLAQR